MGQSESASYTDGDGLFDQLTDVDVDEDRITMPENNLRTLLV